MSIALTGGIASGKTFVADELAQRGAVIIDSDVLAREVVEPGTEGLEAVANRFGAEILTSEGTLDRPRLGAIIFSDDEARADLNAIIHPLVRQRSLQLAKEAPADAVVIHVIPLLVETGLDEAFDTRIVVDAPVEVQVSRLMRRNDLSVDDAHARVRAQASRPERLAVADHVIDNSGDTAATVRQIEALWAQLTAT